MPKAEGFEVAGGQRLPLGGLNGYAGVRGKQGRKKDKFQGTTPRKKHRTGLFDSPLEAAIGLAQLREDLELGMLELVALESGRQKRRSRPPRRRRRWASTSATSCSRRAPLSRRW